MIDSAIEKAQSDDIPSVEEQPLVFRDPKSSVRLSAGKDGADVLLPNNP